ncbi:MAG: Rho termination factor N-terminal domain-containing protein [Deltaproteobacteria bacterium]|nr:Rho termination factor N-terminal domain-containing protein [Deltaproteobacteria bacterium]
MARKHKKAAERERDPERAHEPRPFWSGTITFGLVSVPVELFAGHRGSGTPLRMLSPEGQPLRRRYVCSADGEVLESDDIVRGHPREDGGFITVSDEELDAVAPERSREIDLQHFVPEGALDAFARNRAYFLLPAGEVSKPYRLLARVMAETGRVGLAHLVMRGVGYSVAITAARGILRAETLRTPDELRSAEAVGLASPGKAPAKRRDAMKAALEAQAASELDPDELRDRDAEAMAALVRDKADEAVDVVRAPEPSDDDEGGGSVIDIMEVLRRRLGVRDREGKQPRGGRTMPDAWSDKDEKQYEHVKKSERDKGRSKDRAEEIAARTVNKQRKEEGRTKSDQSRATGNPNRSLEDRTKDELYNRAKELDIEGRSQMSKSELVSAIRKRN